VDFELSEEQKILQKSARDFLRKECPKELIRAVSQSHEGYSTELWGKMAELGWMGLMVPEAYGGSGMTFLDLTVLLEEMGYNLCPGPFLASAVLAGPAILTGGNEEQKAELLPKISSGEKIFTVALYEPKSTFDAVPRQVTGSRVNGHYELKGTKLFVPDAHVADYILCPARTKEHPDPKQGITVFLVDAGSPGLACTLLRTISWDKQCEVVLDNVRVPSSRVIGRTDQGWPLVRDMTAKAAVARSAEMIGHCQASLDMAVAYAKERVQFDRPIGTFQAVQHHLADMWLDISGTRNLVYQAAWKISAGIEAERDVAMTKARTGEISRKVTKTAHMLFGAIGYTMEHDLHLYYRRVVAGDMAYGNSDFHYEEVAKSLGL